MNFYPLIRRILFQFDPEKVHGFTLKTLQLLYQLRLLSIKIEQVPRTVMGIAFPNPVGLAGGFDRHAEYMEVLSALGFGFMEVGTITPKPQPGNPKPRLFRLPEAQALINRIGFYSKGIEHALSQLQRSHYAGALGINIGKNLTTPIEAATNDYLTGMRAFYSRASYLTINISSPNTPNLRQLQYGKYLQDFLMALKNEQKILAGLHQRYVPLVIKIDPDLSEQELMALAENIRHYGIDGVIATNTTLDRHGVNGMQYANEQGGLSGAPLFERSLQMVTKLNELFAGSVPIIALGGIMSAEQAKQMLDAGASLLQIYTGFVYHGPRLIRDIVHLVKV